jgi:hypothetical protein
VRRLLDSLDHDLGAVEAALLEPEAGSVHVLGEVLLDGDGEDPGSVDAAGQQVSALFGASEPVEGQRRHQVGEKGQRRHVTALCAQQDSEGDLVESPASHVLTEGDPHQPGSGERRPEVGIEPGATPLERRLEVEQSFGVEPVGEDLLRQVGDCLLRLVVGEVHAAIPRTPLPAGASRGGGRGRSCR